MNKHYDIEAAKNAIEALASEEQNGDDRRLAMVTQEVASMGQLNVVCYEGPTTWRLIFDDGQHREEAVFTVRGAILRKDLPPVLERPQTATRARYLRQGVTLTGYGSPTFDAAIAGTCALYTLFERTFVEGKLEAWGPSDVTAETAYDKTKTLNMSNRYLTPRKDAPDMEHIKFSPLVDPHGILEQMVASGSVHGEDNEVLYFVSEVDADGKRSYKPVAPQTFRVGDIVEAQVSLVAIPLKGSKFKVLAVLRSIVLLDARFTEAAKVKARENAGQEGREKETLKRRVGYEVQEGGKRGNMV